MDRPTPSEIIMHNEQLVDGTYVRKIGIQQWISDFMTSENINITSYIGTIMRNSDLRLTYRCGRYYMKDSLKIISDNYLYIRIVRLIEQRKNLVENKEELKPKLDEITLDPEISKQIIEAAQLSMGSDISQVDLLNIKYFSDRVDNLIKYREKLRII
jgi:nucleolar protein 56